MAKYCTVDEVYKITGLSSDVVDTTTVEFFIEKADRKLLALLAVGVRNEVLDGSIDGSNKEYFCKHIPIADINFDKSISTSDVKVYTWTDITDEDTRTEVTVSSINEFTGRVVLATPPSSDVEAVTMNYHYYKQEIDWELVSLASAQLAGYLAIGSEFYLVPTSFSLGSLRIRHEYPQSRLWKDFVKTLNEIRSRPYSARRPKDMKLVREELR